MRTGSGGNQTISGPLAGQGTGQQGERAAIKCGHSGDSGDTEQLRTLVHFVRVSMLREFPDPNNLTHQGKRTVSESPQYPQYPHAVLTPTVIPSHHEGNCLVDALVSHRK